MKRGLASGGPTTAHDSPPSLDANIVRNTYSAHMSWSVRLDGDVAAVTSGHDGDLASPVNFAVPLSCVPQSIVPSAEMSP